MRLSTEKSSNAALVNYDDGEKGKIRSDRSCINNTCISAGTRPVCPVSERLSIHVAY